MFKFMEKNRIKSGTNGGYELYALSTYKLNLFVNPKIVPKIMQSNLRTNILSQEKNRSTSNR